MSYTEISVEREVGRYGYYVHHGCSAGIPQGEHRHNGLEIMVVHSGTAQFQTGGWTACMLPGTAVVLDAVQPHRTTALLKQHYIRTALHFADDMLSEADAAHVQHCLAQERSQLLSLTGDAATRFFWAIQQLNLLRGRRTESATISHLIGLALCALQRPGNVRTTVPTLVLDAMNYMRINLDRAVSVGEVAKALYCSERHLHRLFTAHVGYSPQQYWLLLKVERACELLQTNLTVNELASAIGFGSLNGFYRTFRKITGLSPSQYRAAHTAGHIPPDHTP